MKRNLLILGATLLLLLTMATAQRRGGGAGMPAGQSGQHGAAGQHGQMGTGTGMGTGIGTHDQQRLRIHATDQQRQQLRDCTQSADQLRTRTRDMARQSKKSAITPEQAKQWREQLRHEVRVMNQNHEQFMAGLSQEQKAASQLTLQQMEQSRNRLLKASELLENELIAPELQSDRIREQARETERAAHQLRKHQTDLVAQLTQ